MKIDIKTVIAAVSVLFACYLYFTPMSDHEAVCSTVAGHGIKFELWEVRQTLNYYHGTYRCHDPASCRPNMDAATFAQYERAWLRHRELMEQLRKYY